MKLINRFKNIHTFNHLFIYLILSKMTLENVFIFIFSKIINLLIFQTKHLIRNTCWDKKKKTFAFYKYLYLVYTNKQKLGIHSKSTYIYTKYFLLSIYIIFIFHIHTYIVYYSVNMRICVHCVQNILILVIWYIIYKLWIGKFCVKLCSYLYL